MIDAAKKAALIHGVQLQPHQEDVRQRVTDPYSPSRRMLLMHALGSGKSLTALSAAEESGLPYTVVTPASLRENMKKEREKWTDQTVPADVISYNAVASGKGDPEKLDTLVADEAHRLRDPNSEQSRKFRELAAGAKKLLLLTGTPIVNRPGDMAVPLELLTGKKMTPGQFEDRYVGSRRDWPTLFQLLRGQPGQRHGTVAHRSELKNLLRGKVDVFAPDRPTVPVTREDVVTEMSPEQTRIYQAIWGKLPWPLRMKLQYDYDMTASELRKARSFLSGPRAVGLSNLPFTTRKGPATDKELSEAFSSSSKLQEAMRRLKGTLKDPRAKALVFSNFVDAGLRPYQAALAKENIPSAVFHGGLSDRARKKLVEDFSSGKLRVALLGPSGSEGLSPKGTQLIQLLDPHWNSVRSNQSVGRGLRYDSHIGLPEDLQKVKVERYLARLPVPWYRKPLQWAGVDQSDVQAGADDYLIRMSNRKDEENAGILDLIKEVSDEARAARRTVNEEASRT